MQVLARCPGFLFNLFGLPQSEEVERGGWREPKWLRQTAYGPPSEFGGLLLGLLLQPLLLSIGSSLKIAQVHPVSDLAKPLSCQGPASR